MGAVSSTRNPMRLYVSHVAVADSRKVRMRSNWLRGVYAAPQRNSGNLNAALFVTRQTKAGHAIIAASKLK